MIIHPGDFLHPKNLKEPKSGLCFFCSGSINRNDSCICWNGTQSIFFHFRCADLFMIRFVRDVWESRLVDKYLEMTPTLFIATNSIRTITEDAMESFGDDLPRMIEICKNKLDAVKASVEKGWLPKP